MYLYIILVEVRLFSELLLVEKCKKVEAELRGRYYRNIL